jgi:hypothetical protein
MPRYFFHFVRDGTRVEDTHGGEFPDLESAQAEAVASAHEAVRDVERAWHESYDGQVEVSDAAGKVLPWPPPQPQISDT